MSFRPPPMCPRTYIFLDIASLASLNDVSFGRYVPWMKRPMDDISLGFHLSVIIDLKMLDNKSLCVFVMLVKMSPDTPGSF